MFIICYPQGKICHQHFLIHNFPLSFWRYLNLKKKRWSLVVKSFKSFDKNCIILLKHENRISGHICEEGAARFKKNSFFFFFPA